MNISVVGINHNTATTDIREKVAFTDSMKIETTTYLLDSGVKECIILSTCNRSEIYIYSEGGNVDRDIEVVKNIYRKKSDIKQIDKYFFVKKEIESIYHLYEVAAGLKSIVLGEDQILGQVKEAHRLAMEIGGSGKRLNKLFRESVTTAKKVKKELKISEIPLSISYIGVKFLKEKIDLKGKKALIIGLGKMGNLALKYLEEENLNQIFMSNRSHDKLYKIKELYENVTPIEYDDRYNIIKDIDILITATACPHHIIRKKDMKKLEKNLYILDLALPRDVEEDVEEIENVNLYNIDNLKEISEKNEVKRKELSKKAKSLINEDIISFKNWIDTLKVDPIVKSMSDKCEEIEKNTLEYIFRKIDLSSRDKKIMENIIHSSFKRIIRNPAIKLKQINDKEKLDKYIEMMSDIYEL